ncbi:MAG: universal stress protein [Blastocatellia bacterium]
MKVLLAVDGSACSAAAVQEVARRPWPADTIIKVFAVAELPYVNVTEPVLLPNDYWAALEHAQRAQAQAATEQAMSALQQQTTVTLLAAQKMGHAASTILDEAQEWGADWIIVGSHGYRGWKRFLLGSVAQAIATHAPCSVEIVRPRHQPSP